LANPGTPVLYGTVSAAMDMKTGAAALGGPEVGLLNVASAQLARYYGLPCRGTGGNTDSKTVDAQAGIETANSLLMASLAGMNFIYDAAGSLDGSLVLSKEKVVIDDEICGMVMRILDGIRVDDDTLAVEEILKVGAAATFLGTPFTMSHHRREHFIPDLLERRSREAWEKDGFRDIARRARDKAKLILREHMPEPIEKDVAADLRAFIEETAKAHGH
jgi:trimethylamine--corrinoid protein Co-methyltransferase